MDDKKLLPDALVCRRYSVTLMTLWRWDRDPDLGFPRPIKIKTRNYRDIAELEAFEERQRARDPQITAWEPSNEEG
jgi:hypothetical protein